MMLPYIAYNGRSDENVVFFQRRLIRNLQTSWPQAGEIAMWLR